MTGRLVQTPRWHLSLTTMHNTAANGDRHQMTTLHKLVCVITNYTEEFITFLTALSGYFLFLPGDEQITGTEQKLENTRKW